MSKAWPIADRAILFSRSRGDRRSSLEKKNCKVIAIANVDDRDIAIARSLIQTRMKANSLELKYIYDNASSIRKNRLSQNITFIFLTLLAIIP